MYSEDSREERRGTKIRKEGWREREREREREEGGREKRDYSERDSRVGSLPS